MHPVWRQVARAATLVAAVCVAAEGSAATLPAGFNESLVASGLASPTAMAIAPDGRIFVGEQGGRLRVIKNGALLATPFLTVTVNASGERGLLGVTLDPLFATNRFVYVYYTATAPTLHNRVSRFTANGDVAVAGSETILLDLDNLSTATNHNGGALHFGPDGKLYIAVGENASGSSAQALSTVKGKILRINRDGTIPSDNPFFGTTTGINRSIWALGLRNPFTFAFEPWSGRMFINDVGQISWEEINEGMAAGNYGWPTTEGYTTDPRYVSPIYAYGHGSGSTTGCAITGGVFYNPVTAQFPAAYVGTYFFADFCSGWIRRLDPATNTTSTFANGIAAPVDLRVLDDGSLLYLARGAGAVYRIRYGATTPAISQHPAARTVAVGAPATFQVSASGATPLAYQWQRNGTPIAGASASSYTIASAQATDNGARFRVVVSNAFGSVTSNEATLTVTNNQLPTCQILQPTSETLYSGGMTITYSGSGSDAEDGDLPASAFTWSVDFHHDTHTHPFLAPTSGAKSGTFAIPRQGETAANVWYRIHLTVRDSNGATRSVVHDVLPRTASVTLATAPAGLQVLLDGQPATSPLTFTGVAGILRTIAVASPQSAGGNSWQFVSWSDGAPRAHVIATPASATTYTATFSGTGGSLYQVTTPNTAVTWRIGATQRIEWTHNLGCAATSRVELSRNGGSTWELLADQVPSSGCETGRYDWTVTGPATTTARIRVRWNSNLSVADQSDVGFSIQPHFLTVTTPKRSATNWGYGTLQKQTWATSLTSADRVNVRLSTDGGQTFPYVLASGIVASKRNVTFLVPTLAQMTTAARVKVEWAANPTQAGVNPVNFGTQSPYVRITAPNVSGTVWTVGQTTNVTWAHNLSALEHVSLELSLDGGITFPITLATSTPSDGKQAFVVQSGWRSEAARVRIRWLKNGSVLDLSDQSFAVR